MGVPLFAAPFMYGRAGFAARWNNACAPRCATGPASTRTLTPPTWLRLHFVNLMHVAPPPMPRPLFAAAAPPRPWAATARRLC